MRLMYHIMCLFTWQVAPADAPHLYVDSYQPAILPSFAAFLPSPPMNPSVPTFAGFFLSNGAPLGGTSLEHLTPDYSVSLDDHCYANYKHTILPVAQTTHVTCSSK